MGYVVTREDTFIAGETMVIDRLVALDGSTANTVIYCDAEHKAIGKLRYPVANGKKATVELLNAQGTFKLVADGAIVANAPVYSADDGKISATDLGRQIGYARYAASTDGNKIEVIVTSGGGAVGQSGTEAWVEAGENIAAGDLVYPSDQLAGVMTVLLAQATSGGNYATYIAPNAIGSGDFGLVVQTWEESGIDTDASSGVNAPVYLDDGTAGNWTFTQPTAADKTQVVGRVVEDDSGTGAILFQVQGSTFLEAHTHTDASEGGNALAAPAITGGSHIEIATFSLRDTVAAYDVIMQSTSTGISADRTITWNIGNANRGITLGGDVDFAGDVTMLGNFIGVGAFAFQFTLTNTTTITFPLTGVLATLDGAETLTSKILTAPDINGGTADSLTGFSIRSSGAAFDLEFDTAEVLTGNRIISWDVGDADRAITLGGDIALAGALTLLGDFVQVGAFNVQITTTGVTTIQLPTTGTLATLDGGETFTNKILTAPDINGGTVDSLTNFSIRSSGAAFDLEFDTAEVLTGNHIISWDVGDTDRAITLGGDLDFGGDFTTLAAWTQVGADTIEWTVTGATTVTLPLTGVLATLAGAEQLENKTLITPTVADLQNMTHDHTDNAGGGQTLVSTILTTPDINGGTADSLTNFSIRSSGAAFDLEFDTAEVLTGNKIISWDVGDTDRAITLGGDVAFAGAVTTLGDFIQVGAFNFQYTLTGGTTVTFPTVGTLATLDGAETLTQKTLTTPTIADLQNMTHTHADAAGGGKLTGLACDDYALATMGILLHFDFQWADLATGDVVIFNANAPFKFQIVNCYLENEGNNGANANTIQLAAGAAGGSPITDAMSLNGKVDTDVVYMGQLDDSNSTIDLGDSLYLRQTKVAGVMGGTAHIMCKRVT